MLRRGQQGYVLALLMVIVAALGATALLVSEREAMTAAVKGDNTGEDLRYVAEAALQHANWALERADCAALAGLANVPFGAHSYDVSISPPGGSPVTLQVLARHRDGLQRVTQQSRRAYQRLNRSLQLLALKDSYVEAAKTTRNNGTRQKVLVSNTTVGGGSGLTHGVVSFDLATVPPAARLTRALLMLFGGSSSDSLTDLEVRRITRDWTEGGVTWDSYDGVNPWGTPGGDVDPQVEATLPQVMPAAWAEIDLTDLVARWLDGSVPNYGVHLSSPQQVAVADDKAFASLDGNNAAQRPYLILDYVELCECGTVC